MTADEAFNRELEIFRTEEESGTQFFYAHLAIHAVSSDDRLVHTLLNTAPLFWNTCAGALQTAAFIALGRVFDQHSAHNIDSLLRIAQKNLDIFSKTALGRRKQGNNSQRPEWLDEYLAASYEPTAEDFRRLRAHVRRRRQIYERHYQQVRHKWFAHKEIADSVEAAILFGKGTIRELQQLFVFLGSLHEALWQLYYNGRRPVLRAVRYSVTRMRDVPSPRYGRALQEQILNETEEFLKSAAKRFSNVEHGNVPRTDMSDTLKQFIRFLEADIKEWKEAADFYDRYIHSVTDLGEAHLRSGRQEVERFRARVSERQKLIEQLKDKAR